MLMIIWMIGNLIQKIILILVKEENSDVNDKESDVEKGLEGSDSSVNDNNLDESASDLDKKGFNLDDNREIGEVNA